MESTAIYRKPKKWVAAALGLFIQPVGMLYVARPGWAAAYFALAVIIVLGNTFMLRGRELAGGLIALLVAMICAIHAYRLARDYRELLRRPWYSRWYGLVGIVAAFAALAFGTRAFLFEPFRFPSGSMAPSIEPRAHLIVRKWGYGNYGTYGIHVMRTGMSSEARRGDIVVFEYPEDTALSYAMRVVGLPGDRISYYNKRLKINDEEVQIRRVADYVHKDRSTPAEDNASLKLLHDSANGVDAVAYATKLFLNVARISAQVGVVPGLVRPQLVCVSHCAFSNEQGPPRRD